MDNLDQPKKHKRLRAWMFTLPITVLLLIASAFQWYHRQVDMHEDAELVTAHALGAALSLYLTDNHDTLPPASNWETNLERLAGNPPLKIPGAPLHDGAGFAMNANAAAVPLSKLVAPGKFIFAYESTKAVFNTIGSFQDAAGLHGRQLPLVIFADGSVARLSPQEFQEAIAASNAQIKEK